MATRYMELPDTVPTSLSDNAFMNIHSPYLWKDVPLAAHVGENGEHVQTSQALPEIFEV